MLNRQKSTKVILDVYFRINIKKRIIPKNRDIDLSNDVDIDNFINGLHHGREGESYGRCKKNRAVLFFMRFIRAFFVTRETSRILFENGYVFP